MAGDDANVYTGYFENAFGEQWIFTYDRDTGRGELRGGDIGWNTTHPVLNGEPGGLMLSATESTWLQTCWNAATGR